MTGDPHLDDRGRGRIRIICDRPPLVVVVEFATGAELAAALRHFDGPTPSTLGVPVKKNETGVSFELVVADDPVLAGLHERMAAVLRVDTEVAPSLRFRRYEIGDAHPMHGDHFEIRGAALATTAMLCLTDVERGGSTRFPRAEPTGVRVAPRHNRLITWFNVDECGADDERAVHEALPVDVGVKMTVTTFQYRPRSCLDLANARRAWL